MMKKKIYITLVGVGFLVFFFLPSAASAAGWGGINIPYWGPLVACQNDPGGICTNLCRITELADNLIRFGFTILLIVIAPIMIMIGGVMILIAGASEKLLSQGKAILKGAVVGVIIALLAYMIVATFLWLIGNSQSGTNRVGWPVVQCSVPPPPGAVPLGNPATPVGTGPGGTTPGGTTYAGKGCPTDTSVAPGSDCIDFAGGEIVFKTGGSPPVGHKAAGKMVDAIYCFDNNYSGQIRVTEAYPPTYMGHASPQHYNGCAIDFTVPKYNAWAFYNIIKPNAESCGLKIINEYASPTGAATGNHYHIELPKTACP